MKQVWMPLRLAGPAGIVFDYTVLVNIKEGEKVPSREEAERAINQCLTLDYANPLPQNYSIN